MAVAVRMLANARPTFGRGYFNSAWDDGMRFDRGS